MPAPVVRFLLVLAVPLSLAAEACMQPSGSASQRVSIPEQPRQAQRVRAATPRRSEEHVDLAPPHDASDELPVTWSAVYGHDLSIDQALVNAEHAATGLATAQASTAGTLRPEQLELVITQLDRTTRAYAAAFHAPNASPIDRVEALAVASAAVLRAARYLDDHGFHDSAGVARTDAKVSLSFEDVDQGPGRHWRSEGLALARHCVRLATTGELRAIEETCIHLLQDFPAVTRRASVGACACDPGDPLCSSSLSGWCRPGSP